MSAVVGPYIRALREQHGWSQSELARVVGVTPSAVSAWEDTAHNLGPGRKNLEKLAEIFNITVDELLSGGAHKSYEHSLREQIEELEAQKQELESDLAKSNRQKRPKILRKMADIEQRLAALYDQLDIALSRESSSTLKIPLLGAVRAGVPTYAEELREGEIEVPASLHIDFALRVRGDSMIEAGIFDGDIALCRTPEHQRPKDRDIVVALVNGDEATLKILNHRADNQWYLIPANRAYQPIRLSLPDDVIQGVMVMIWRYSSSAVTIAESRMPDLFD